MLRTLRFARALSLLAVFGWLGCAPAAPMLSGGQTTPVDRVDLGLGGAFRAPTLDLAPRSGGEEPRAERLMQFAEPGGVAPVAWMRWGIDEQWDFGVMASSSVLRLEARSESVVLPAYAARAFWGISPYGGYARSDRVGEGDSAAEGWRIGALAPLGLALALGGIVEGWGGVRLGFEHAEGDLGNAQPSGSANGFRAGVFLGFAAGFRRVHALIELVIDYEYWAVEIGDAALERQGLALTPGWALRIRF